MARMRLLAEKRDELTPELVPHLAKHNLVMTYRRPGGPLLGSARKYKASEGTISRLAEEHRERGASEG